MEERGKRSRLVGGKCNKQGNLHKRLVLDTARGVAPCTHPPVPYKIMFFFRPVFLFWGSNWDQSHLQSRGPQPLTVSRLQSLQMTPWGMVGRMYIPGTREGWEASSAHSARRSAGSHVLSVTSSSMSLVGNWYFRAVVSNSFLFLWACSISRALEELLSCLEQRSPTFFGTRIQFRGRQFFHRLEVGKWFGDDSSLLQLLCTFSIIIKSVSLRSSGIRSRRFPTPASEKAAPWFWPWRMWPKKSVEMVEWRMAFPWQPKISLSLKVTSRKRNETRGLQLHWYSCARLWPTPVEALSSIVLCFLGVSQCLCMVGVW